MGGMTNVLVPVDGSESAVRAVRWAAQLLAGRPGARLHLVTVRPPVDAWEVRSHLGAEAIEKMAAADAAGVLEPAAAIAREAGVTVETHAVQGDDVAARVVAEVHALGCDAIVMGTRGLGAVQSVLLGSTTQQVIHLAEVPVTVIK